MSNRDLIPEYCVAKELRYSLSFAKGSLDSPGKPFQQFHTSHALSKTSSPALHKRVEFAWLLESGAEGWV